MRNAFFTRAGLRAPGVTREGAPAEHPAAQQGTCRARDAWVCGARYKHSPAGAYTQTHAHYSRLTFRSRLVLLLLLHGHATGTAHRPPRARDTAQTELRGGAGGEGDAPLVFLPGIYVYMTYMTNAQEGRNGERGATLNACSLHTCRDMPCAICATHAVAHLDHTQVTAIGEMPPVPCLYLYTSQGNIRPVIVEREAEPGGWHLPRQPHPLGIHGLGPGLGFAQRLTRRDKSIAAADRLRLASKDVPRSK
jgi:hypothetical protein